MAEVFRLPKMGQTMTEATILKWLKQEGEAVEGWEGIVEVDTDKINMEVEPQVAGTVRKLLVAEGTVVPVGAPIAVIGAPEEDISGLLAGLSSAPVSAAAPEAGTSAASPSAAGAVATNGGAAPEAASPTPAAGGEIPSVSPRARETAAEGGVDWHTLSIGGSGFEGMVVERDVLAYLQQGEQAPQPEPLATPLAAKMAADLGVPLGDVAGSGPRGRVTSGDVRAAASSRRPARVIEAREIPLKGMRRTISRRLQSSYQQAAHVHMRVGADMSACAELRRQLKPELESLGARLSYTDLIAGAIVQALIALPALNATLEEDVVRIHASVNLGVAVALEDGLIVPVVRDAQNLRLLELGAAIVETAERARARKLPAEAFQGGTFTLTNLGQYGVDTFDPIINPPQVGILGTGRILDTVVAVNGAPAVRPMLQLTLGFDHRVIDGAPAAQFLSQLKELLENPSRLLL